MPVPDFSPGEVLTASAMDSIGLWLVKTQTVGAGVASVTVTDAFSADYDNYKVVYTNGVSSSGSDMRLTLGASAASYYGGLIFNRPNAATPSGIANNNGAFWQYGGGLNNANGIINSFELYQPFLARRTGVYSQIIHTEGAASALGTFSGFHDVASSFTAFTLTPSSGTLTGGTIRVYGYRN